MIKKNILQPLPLRTQDGRRVKLKNVKTLSKMRNIQHSTYLSQKFQVVNSVQIYHLFIRLPYYLANQKKLWNEQCVRSNDVKQLSNRKSLKSSRSCCYHLYLVFHLSRTHLQISWSLQKIVHAFFYIRNFDS